MEFPQLARCSSADDLRGLDLYGGCLLGELPLRIGNTLAELLDLPLQRCDLRLRSFQTLVRIPQLDFPVRICAALAAPLVLKPLQQCVTLLGELREFGPALFEIGGFQ